MSRRNTPPPDRTGVLPSPITGTGGTRSMLSSTVSTIMMLGSRTDSSGETEQGKNGDGANMKNGYQNICNQSHKFHLILSESNALTCVSSQISTQALVQSLHNVPLRLQRREEISMCCRLATLTQRSLHWTEARVRTAWLSVTTHTVHTGYKTARLMRPHQRSSYW